MSVVKVGHASSARTLSVPPAQSRGQLAPGEVGISFEMTLNSVNDAMESFYVELDIKYTWLAKGWVDQYRAAGAPKKGTERYDALVTNCWRPKLYIRNVTDRSEVVSEITICIDQSRGQMHCFSKMRVELSEALELQHFPFDKQLLAVHLGTYQDTTEVIFVPYPGRSSVVRSRATRWSTLNEERPMMVLPDPKALGLVATSGRAYHRCFMTIEARRDSFWYRINLILPHMLIVLMTANVVLVPRDEVADRCSISLTLLLTVVAFRFTLVSEVPKKSYATVLDQVMNGGLLILLIMSVLIFVHADVRTEDGKSAVPDALRLGTSDDDDQVFAFEYVFALVSLALWLLVNLFLMVSPMTGLWESRWFAQATSLSQQQWLSDAFVFSKDSGAAKDHNNYTVVHCSDPYVIERYHVDSRGRHTKLKGDASSRADGAL